MTWQEYAVNSDDCVRHYSIKTLNPELQQVNTKPTIIKKLDLLDCKVQAILVLKYKKTD